MLLVIPIQPQQQTGTGTARILLALFLASKTLAVGGFQWLLLE
ncbi:hypothetical protein [Pseudomonas tolaasii]